MLTRTCVCCVALRCVVLRCATAVSLLESPVCVRVQHRTRQHNDSLGRRARGGRFAAVGQQRPDRRNASTRQVRNVVHCVQCVQCGVCGVTAVSLLEPPCTASHSSTRRQPRVPCSWWPARCSGTTATRRMERCTWAGAQRGAVCSM